MLPPPTPPAPASGQRSSPPSQAPRQRHGLWARLDRLHTKLFIAIAGTNALLALVAYLVFSWSFDQGFGDYLNRAEEARLQPLVQRLAEGHEREGHWRWLSEDRRRWYELVRDLGGQRQRRGEEAGGSASAAASAASAPRPTPLTPSPPSSPTTSGASAATTPPSVQAEQPRPERGSDRPPPPLLTIDPRLMLFDANRSLLVGRQEMADEAVLKAVKVKGQTVGYLGYVPRVKMVESLETAYSSQQGRKFAAIAVGMLLAGMLIGALVARWLARRIRGLADGAHALIQGDYSARIGVQGQDELAELAQDFNQLAQTLEAARQARQQWIADIAHELRTPLAVLRAEIEALQDGVRPLGPQALDSLAQEIGQLSRLVEDLRLLSLSDMGALTYYKEALDLGELLEDGITSQRHALQDRGFQLQLALPTGIRVLADGTRLGQVVANLLQNTLNHTDDPGRLSVQLRAEAGQARLVWEDSAPGVSAEDLPRLTERLFRVETSRSRAADGAGGGSGLGLAIVRAIVEGHGGQLSAHPSPLGGLRWEISLPLLPTAAPSSRPASGAAHA